MSHIVTTKESNRRLLLLSAFLRTLPQGRFNYRHWVGFDWKGNPDLSCGTMACAMGWATTIPEFRALGLSMDHFSYQPIILTPDGEVEVDGGIKSAEFLFGLCYSDAEQLFVPSDGDSTESAVFVAEKIERFVAKRS